MRERLNSFQLRELLSYDPTTGLFVWRFRQREWFETLNAFRRWNTIYAGEQAFTNVDLDGYKRGKILNLDYKAHLVAWCMCFGYYPKLIDHDDGDRTNNRLWNLRNATFEQNARNAALSKANSSGVTGVNWHHCGKWNARINHKGKRLDLGFYDLFEDAVSVRQSAEIVLGYHPKHGKR